MSSRIVAFFATFETKDWLTLIATIVALIFSFLSYFQKKGESFWANRRQLSDTLGKLGELNVEMAKLRARPDSQVNYAGLLNDQRRYLVRHAAELIRRVKSTVTTSEYLTIAWGFDAIDDVASADVYFSKAIKSLTERLEHGLAIRSYARFLESNGEYEKSHIQYQEAMSFFSGNNNRARFYRGDTFERRGMALKERGRDDEAKGMFDSARAEYETIDNLENKKRLLRRLLRTESPATQLGETAWEQKSEFETEA